MLIVGLVARGAHVLLCTPLVVDRRERTDPVACLVGLPRRGHFPASLGGWNPVGVGELPTYTLAGCYYLMAGDLTMAELFASHPACKPLRFVKTLHVATCARLLSYLCDPRWFVDRDKPDRVSKLTAFLGLSPQTFPCEQSDIVLKAWGGDRHVDDGDDPRHFLFRVTARRPERTLLRRTQAFVEFLRAVWLQALTPRVELFVPEHFFRRSDEADAYRKWMESDE
jgi:hypothetical protein